MGRKVRLNLRKQVPMSEREGKAWDLAQGALSQPAALPTIAAGTTLAALTASPRLGVRMGMGIGGVVQGVVKGLAQGINVPAFGFPATQTLPAHGPTNAGPAGDLISAPGLYGGMTQEGIAEYPDWVNYTPRTWDGKPPSGEPVVLRPRSEWLPWGQNKSWAQRHRERRGY